MADPIPVHAPASSIAPQAVAFGPLGSTATMVDRTNPLPVTAGFGASGAAPLSGTLSASGSVGPFTPELGRAVWLTLSGVWSGTVQLLRSTDGGATRLPVTFGDGTVKGIWTGPVNAPVAEESVAAATYYLGVTLASGTLSYEVRQ